MAALNKLTALNNVSNNRHRLKGNKKVSRRRGKKGKKGKKLVKRNV